MVRYVPAPHSGISNACPTGLERRILHWTCCWAHGRWGECTVVHAFSQLCFCPTLARLILLDVWIHRTSRFCKASFAGLPDASRLRSNLLKIKVKSCEQKVALKELRVHSLKAITLHLTFKAKTARRLTASWWEQLTNYWSGVRN